jgi:16S rRNA (cytosine967-C5)-methyltransferase
MVRGHRTFSKATFPFMPPLRFAPPTEVPGLAARRIAADILDGVLHKRRTLDDQLDGAGAHPGLKTLSDRSTAAFRPTRRARRVRC